MENIVLVNNVTWLEQIGLSEGLIAACIVGILGLCGVLITQNFERKKEHYSFLRMKFEELVFRLIDFAAIIKKIEAKRFLNNIDETLDIDKFYKEGAKIEVLITLYFSELEAGYKSFLKSGADLLIAQREYEKNNTADLLKILQQYEDEFDIVYDDLYKNIKSCIATYTHPLKSRGIFSSKTN